MYVLYDSTCRGISRSDELNNVLKNAYEISAEYQRNCSYGVNIGDYGKGNLEQKHETPFRVSSRTR
jgi:threonylcarbamoyladenosine tRNA methylthiotransferase MtaB